MHTLFQKNIIYLVCIYTIYTYISIHQIDDMIDMMYQKSIRYGVSRRYYICNFYHQLSKPNARPPLLQCMRFGNKATVLQTSSPLFRLESSDVSLQKNPSSWWTNNLQPVIAEASCKTDWCPWACEAWVVERGTHLLRSVCTASEVVLCTNPNPHYMAK